MPLPTGCVLLRLVIGCALWVVGNGKSRERKTTREFERFLLFLNQEPGHEASERRTWAQRAGTALRSFEGRVHDLGRRTKDGFAAFDALLALLTSDLSPLSPLVFAKNLRLDAQRRNEEQIFWLWNEEPLFCPFEGRVHDLGRRTKDGYSAFNGYLGGRRTDNGVRLLKMESVPFFSRQSLISGHYAAG